MIHAKVSASSLGAGLGVYIIQVLTNSLHLHTDASVQALMIAVVTAAVTFVAGFLKNEHVITEAQYDSFIDAPDVEPQARAAEVPPAYEETIE